MAQEYTNDDGSTGTYNEMEVEVIPVRMVRPKLGMQMAMEPIQVQMDPLVLILQMVRIPTTMLMAIRSAGMQKAIKAMKVQMAQPPP